MHAHQRSHCRPQRVSCHHQLPAAAVKPTVSQQVLEVFWGQPIFNLLILPRLPLLHVLPAATRPMAMCRRRCLPLLCSKTAMRGIEFCFAAARQASQRYALPPPPGRRARQLAVPLLLLLAQRVQAVLAPLLLRGQRLAGQQGRQDLVLVKVLGE